MKQFSKKLMKPWSPASASFWLTSIGLRLAFSGKTRPIRFIGATMLITAGFGGWGSIAREVAMRSDVPMQPFAIARAMKNGSLSDEMRENIKANFLQHGAPAAAGLVAFARR